MEMKKKRRIFERDMLVFSDSFAVIAHTGLRPNPQIRKNSVAKLRALNRSTTGICNRITAWIKSLLNIKIPVYQAALGMIILVLPLLFFSKQSVMRFPLMGKDHTSSRNLRDQVGTKNMEVFNLINNQKIGRNIVEDSLIFRILVLPDSGYTLQKTDSVISQLL